MTIDLILPSSDRVPSSKSSAGAGAFEDAWEDGNKETIK